MVLGDVEETVTTTEIDEETFEQIIKVSSSMVYTPAVSPAAPPGRRN